jgi:tetratricopeptide (TPR) repeat protein
MTKAKSIRICLVMMCFGGTPASLVRHVEIQDLERSQASFIFSHSAYGKEVATGCDFNAIDSLLQVEGMKLDPDTKRIIESLDACLDFNPQEKDAWVRLGKALAWGVAKSRHVESARDAWARAYELDPRDCHIGALLARSLKGEEGKQAVRHLFQDHPRCADALYLEATVLTSSGQERVRVLEKSLEAFRSAEASLALGHEYIRVRKFHEAIVPLTQALDAPVLFNEYWGYHGWAVTHAQLGLAWAHFKAGHPKEARSYFRLFSRSMLDPGPWHDLTPDEEKWQDILQTRLRRPQADRGK